MDNPGPDHIFISAYLIRQKLEEGRVGKGTETT